MARPKANRSATEAIRHQDTRANIPTEELREFVAEDEATPKTMLYARDPSLDPQLVWKGKDEQDAADLEVPVVPIYIQEKIQPQAIIENLVQQQGKAQADEPQLSLFADFDGIEEFDQKVDFYHHPQNWSNRMILGDSLLVMTSLAEKEGLKGKVQTIYLDPPYGIKFGSNWQVSTRKRDLRDGRAEDATRQPEQVRAFRDTWQLGIHSYLAYLRDRLVVSRELLTETGSIFVQIGDENVHLVRCLLDEIFGVENHCSEIVFVKTSAASSELLAGVNDRLLWYAKSKESVKYRQLYFDKIPGAEGGSGYTKVLLPDGTERRLTEDEFVNPGSVPTGSRIFASDNLTSQRPPGDFPVEVNGRVYRPGKGYWKTGPDGFQRLIAANRVKVTGGDRLAYVRYLDDFPVVALNNVWTDTLGQNQFGGDKVYVVQTGLTTVQRCLLMTTDPGDLVLDPTCGSGTIAYVAEQWGRRWITIDTSRVALALARTRLMAARYPYYLLQDSPEGQAKEAELTGHVPPAYNSDYDIRKGFVYKRVPHVMLKSIANNPEIREGMTRAGIDAAIARHADTETLFDQPYEDNKRVRVSGPFTVESLSPHRMLPTDEEAPASINEGQREGRDFATMILDNLKKAGVQNTVKQERLKFDRLEPFAGNYLQGEGEYTEQDGTVKRVAISIGPEFGTVGPDQIKEAAKEALRGAGFDLLIVCGFAFDAHANETANEFQPVNIPKAGIVAEQRRQYGKLPMLLARMNPDLAMGDELLKKTGAGNLFMVFGEPDVAIQKQGDGQIVVEIRGVDVYDPTTGEIRSNSTDEIACWFIDTDYNEESFFVRHAYFTGAEEPYDKLKRALRAEIDEGAWSSLYSTTSRPFPAPRGKKIAVKVINHYGDEVLKVYAV